MIRGILSVLILFLLYSNSMGQNVENNIKNNSIKIEKLDSLNLSIYSALKNYHLIMIGEIHGTNEPINFIRGLVNLFTAQGDSIQVGFEIPSEYMTDFFEKHKANSFTICDFFLNPSGDGRASDAWYKALLEINKNKKAKIFFFGENMNETKNDDTVMYLNIKNRIEQNPNYKFITISGNMHNIIQLDDRKISFGAMLRMDQGLIIKDRICSLDHIFKGGQTIWNEFKEMETIYSKVGYDNYLYLYPKDSNEMYDGFFYTKYLTKSESAVSSK